MSPTLADGVPIDLDRLLVSRLLAQANAGAGKSWALRRLLEQTHGLVQQIVIDSEGEFHTLRERYDYVLAAPHGGDCAATPKTAALLARKLLELQVSAIVDISELKKHEKMLFVRRFLEAVVGAPRSLWHPLLLFLDEAHLYAPQAGQAESLNAVVDLMARGRKRGFAGILATQRISKIHKDAIAECNNMLIGRAALDVDMKRAADALGFNTRDQQHELRALKPGEFFAFGPALSDQVRRIHIGPVATTHPKAGAAAPPSTKPSDTVRRVLAGLSDLPAEADEEARTVEDLRREVTKLKREARQRPTATPVAPSGPTEAQVKRQVQAAVAEATQPLTAQIRALETNAKQHARYRRGVEAAFERLGKAVGVSVAEPATTDTRSLDGKKVGPVVELPIPRPSTTVNGPIADGITGPQQRILDAIAWLEMLGFQHVSRQQVGFLASYKPTSGGFNNLLGGLRSAGLIDYPVGGRVAFTEDGRALANHPEAPPSQDELHVAVMGKLSGPQQKVLTPVIDAHPNDIDRATIADITGYSANSGGFNNLLGSLRTLGLVDYPTKGRVKAEPVLFLGP